MKKTPLKIDILRNFIILMLLATTMLLGLQYYSSVELATDAVNKNFHQASKNIVKYIASSQDYTQEILEILSLDSLYKQKITNKNSQLFFEDFLHIITIAPRVKSIYIGYKNNDFYEIINLNKDPSFCGCYNVPEMGRYAVVSRFGGKNTITYIDEKLNIIKQTTAKLQLDVVSRPWYKEAIKSNKAIRTDIYRFKSSKKLGITFAKYIKKSGAVIGIDYTLDELSSFLQEQNFNKDSYILLYQSHGKRVATSHKISQQNWQKLMEFFKDHPKNQTQLLQYNNKEYFTYHTSSLKNDMHIGVLIPKDSLLDIYIKKIIDSLYAAVGFVLFTIVLIFYSSSKITRPIRLLMQQNKKIIQNRFDEVDTIDTNILELHELSVSFVSMSKNIQQQHKAQEMLLDSIIQLIAKAIDTKSTYTGGHCRRVPEIAEMLLDEANKDQGVFKDFSFVSKDELKAFHIGAWLHDCGKVTTPEYVVDKAVRLEGIYNRIHEIRTRFEVIYRDAKIEYLQTVLSGGDEVLAKQKLSQKEQKLQDDFEFLAMANSGDTYMTPQMCQRVHHIAKESYIQYFDERLGLSDDEAKRYEDENSTKGEIKTQHLLSDRAMHIIKRVGFDYKKYKADGFKEEVPKYLYNYGEIYNLTLQKGTLTPEERFKIDEHVIMSIRMLEQIPFPENLSKIPQYAGTHHETMIGTGYPKKLTKSQLSIPSRIMAIADIFEALSASDRPYKKAKKLSESLEIMYNMAKKQQIDIDLFRLFVKSGVYMRYAKVYLKKEQIDEVDTDMILD